MSVTFLPSLISDKKKNEMWKASRDRWHRQRIISDENTSHGPLVPDELKRDTIK